MEEDEEVVSEVASEHEEETEGLPIPEPEPETTPEPAPKRQKTSKKHSQNDANVTTLEPSITIVRGEADGTTTYYKIISTSQPGASSLPIHGGGTGSEANAGKVQLINGSLHFPNGTVVAPSTSSGEVLNNDESGLGYASQPTMVSVSIPGTGMVGARYRGVNLEDMDSKRKGSGTRDERRRQTHNEVERRRRDKINQWITKLQALIPGTPGESTKHAQSKGAVLSKAVDYITQLTDQVAQAKTMKDNSQKVHLLAIENEVYKKQTEVLKNYIREQGLELPSNMPTAALSALHELQQGTAILIAQQTTRTK
ncbi:hypothetical protein RvY_11861 [Ramazzottius varieornatus]|uniref:BHLH domain-containing protein n=1 Tax=Ramazzottius varieornatus TaxID=947166 RepID=A0A1D1VQ73_RAMVA|nr:hypothetical protein RvY_11861 [Ramazzottius varieornatus]